MSKIYDRYRVVFLVILLIFQVLGCVEQKQGRDEGPLIAELSAEEHALADSLFQRALVDVKNYRIKSALQLLDSTLEVDSTHFLAHFQKGLLFRRLNEIDASSRAYQAAVRFNPDFLDAWYNLANNAFWQKKYVDAIDLYEQLLDRGRAPAFFHNKGRAHMALGDYEAALESFGQSVLMDSSYSFGYASMGALAEQQGNYTDMHKQYSKAVLLEPDSDEYRYKLGMADMRMGNISSALEAWDATLALNPFHFGALFNKGKVLNQQGDPGALSILDQAEAIRQVDAEIQRLKRGSERFPEDAYYHHALGNLYVERKQWDAAIREFRLATVIEPQDIRSIINLGNVYAMLDQPDKAITSYQQALNIEPSSVDVLQNLAVVYLNGGQLKKSLDHWERILEIEPDNPVASRAVAQLSR